MKRRLFLILPLLIATLLVYQHFRSSAAHAQSGSEAVSSRILIPWFTGDDAGYSTLLYVLNATMNPYGSPQQNGSCMVDAYYNGMHYGPAQLPTNFTNNALPPGQLAVVTEPQIAAATGVPLANSGQRAYLYLTCNFAPVNAQVLFVNPGGVVTFAPGYEPYLPPPTGKSLQPLAK